jgi:hypothetical protein
LPATLFEDREQRLMLAFQILAQGLETSRKFINRLLTPVKIP